MNEAGTTAAEAPGVNEAGTLLTVFTNPKKTFEKMAERPRFLFAIVLVLMVAAGLTVPLMLSDIIQRESVEKLQAKGVSDAQIDAYTKFFDSPAALPIVLGSQVLVIAFVMLLSSGLAFFLGNLMMGANVRFQHYLSATAYGSVVGLVDGAATIAIALARGSTDVRFGVGNFFGDELSIPLKLLDTMTDPLFLWGIAVTALGISVYSKKSFRFGMISSIPVFLVKLLMIGSR